MIDDPRWMKQSKFTEITGYSADTLQKWRDRGLWRDGWHFKLLEGNIAVSYARVMEWIETWTPDRRTGNLPEELPRRAARSKRDPEPR